MAKKNSSKLARLNVFANSPKIVKLFGPLIIVLMVIDAGYGIYSVLRQNSSDAGLRNNTYSYNSQYINHPAGHVGTHKLTSHDPNLRIHETNVPEKKVWTAGWLDGSRFVWTGPGVNLETQRQYIGCFFYSFTSSSGSAQIDVINNKDVPDTDPRLINSLGSSKGILHSYIIKASDVKQGGKFNRTCLAFYVPKSMKNNGIELRVKHISGTLDIRMTKITRIPSKTKELSNLYLLKKGQDNNTVIHSTGFTD